MADLEKAGLAELRTGPFGTQLHAHEYVDEGVPVINVRNLGWGNLRADTIECIDATTAVRLEAHRLLPGDIVFGRKGAVDRHLLIGQGQAGWIQGSDCLRLRIKPSAVLPRFLSYALRTRDHVRWMENQCSHGATMASLNQAIVSRIGFRLPDIGIQGRIAGILAAYDDLIENNLRRIKILEEMAQSLYEEWFVDFRFPEHESVLMVDSLLGMIPEGWETPLVGEELEVLGGGTPDTRVEAYYADGSINWYTPSDLTASASVFMDASSRKITGEALRSSSARLFPPFSVMMTSRATIGVVAINTTEAATNQGFIVCLPNERVPVSYLYHWFRGTRELFENLASGATFKELRRSTFREIPILVPSPEVMADFASACQPVMDLLLALQRKNTVLRQTRDLLLPKLISGEIDVSDLDIDIGEDAA